jgi:hypothetical protein
MALRYPFGLLASLLSTACFNPEPVDLATESAGSTSSASTGPDLATATSEDPDTTSNTAVDSTADSTTTPTSAESSSSSSGSSSESSEGDPVCGDGVATGDEDCDDEGESASCNADCTLVMCGDAIINATAGEECDDAADNGPTRRCSDVCIIGAGLDGTFGMVWESLPPAPMGGEPVYGLQSFHYVGQQFLHDFSANLRFDLVSESWSTVPVPLPYGNTTWANAATDPESHWVPRDGSLWRYELASTTWTQAASGVPDGSIDATAAVFDGQGRIWWHANNGLVSYDPVSSTEDVVPHAAFGDMYETRVGYDPRTNSIVFSGFYNDTLVIYSLDDDTFTQSPSPGGFIRDNSCQDRSGHFYVGSETTQTLMYQFDVETGVFTPLPPLPFVHDNNSSCVVSQEGYLYVGNSPATLARLPLGTL